MSIKSRIQGLAAQRHETLAKLERKLGIGNGTITKWDKRSPSSEKLAAVADHYNVTTDYLLGRTDTPQFTRKDERDVQKIRLKNTWKTYEKRALMYKRCTRKL